MPDSTLDLVRRKCLPCEGGVAPLTAQQIGPLLKGIDGWSYADGAIAKTYSFKIWHWLLPLTLITTPENLPFQNS